MVELWNKLRSEIAEIFKWRLDSVRDNLFVPSYNLDNKLQSFPVVSFWGCTYVDIYASVPFLAPLNMLILVKLNKNNDVNETFRQNFVDLDHFD